MQSASAEKDDKSKTLEDKRSKRVQIKSNLPKVNKDLFLKLKDTETSGKKKKANATLLEDDRFGALFSDDRFQVDTEEETYKLLNPVVNKLDEASTLDAVFSICLTIWRHQYR